MLRFCTNQDERTYSTDPARTCAWPEFHTYLLSHRYHPHRSSRSTSATHLHWPRSRIGGFWRPTANRRECYHRIFGLGRRPKSPSPIIELFPNCEKQYADFHSHG